MSSGFFGFFAHTGVMTVLEDEGLLPARLSGSSAGALVGGAWAAGLDAPAFRDVLLALRREDFWDPAPGIGLLRGSLFRRRLEAMLPVRTFEACRAPVTVSVFDAWARETRVISYGELAPAIQTSCTVPGLFHPTWVAGRPLFDGGIFDCPGLLGMPAGGRVLFHHLASRSPWRAKNGDAMRIPVRAGMNALVIHGLPRVGPFRLAEGSRAFEQARRAARVALDRPIAKNTVEVHAA